MRVGLSSETSSPSRTITDALSADFATPRLRLGIGAYVGKLAVGGFLLGLFETSIAKMRVFRVPEFLGAALMLGLLATLLRFVSGSF